MEFLSVKTLDEAMNYGKFLGDKIHLDTEILSLSQSLKRYLAEDICASENLPAFNRSTVDGYAICYEDVNGASEALPSIIKMVGRVEMGRADTLTLKRGEGAYVPTGGKVPEGADAVVMIEHCDKLESTSLLVYQPVHYNENINRIGDDVQKGQLLLEKGHRVGPHDIGLIAAFGLNKVSVYKPLKVSILSTGDELADLNQPLKEGQIRDINGYALAANVMEDGCEVVRQLILPDDFHVLRDQVKNCLADSDLILLSGGSSAGTKDHTKEVIFSMPGGSLWTHGLAIKPGKPTLIGSALDKPIIGLPGHPSAALLLYQLVVQRIVEEVYQTKALKPIEVKAELESRVHGASGKDTFVMVQLKKMERGLIAQPIYGKSGLISLMAKTCGYLQISKDQEGLEAGSIVSVSVIHPQLIQQEVSHGSKSIY